MPEFSEYAARILANLEEAHAEEVCSTMNTVFAPTGSRDEVQTLQQSLTELVDLGLVDLAYDRWQGPFVELSKEQALTEIETFGDRLNFSQSEQSWQWDTTNPFIQILATELGVKDAERILDERGYEWWKSQS